MQKKYLPKPLTFHSPVSGGKWGQVSSLPPPSFPQLKGCLEFQGRFETILLLFYFFPLFAQVFEEFRNQEKSIPVIKM